MRIGWGSDQGDVRGAITEDEVTTGKESLVVIGVDWTPLQSEGVVAEFDQSLAIARVTTSGSTPGLERRTSKSTDESWCISSSVLNWVSWTSLSDVFYLFFSYMRDINHNWSAAKQRLHPQSVAEISRHSVLSGDRIRQCETSSGSRHKDTDQCL